MQKAKSQLDQLSSFADLDNFGNFVNTLKREEKKNEDKTSKSPVGQGILCILTLFSTWGSLSYYEKCTFNVFSYHLSKFELSL